MARLRPACDEAEYGVGKCSICGRYAAAEWRGGITLKICKTCAMHVLPRLIADAMVDGERSSYADILAVFDSLKAPFLAAALCQVTVHGRDRRVWHDE